ncbi:MAG: amino acid transport protein [Candidatus Omnitrophota bacterium]
MNTTNIFASIIFGSIGLGAFIYGKKQSNLKALVIGVVLMIYPYFMQNPIALFATGTGLTVLLFIF